MKSITLFIFIFSPLLILSNAIYAISTSRTMAVINLVFLGILIIIGSYFMWLEFYPSKAKKDKIIKDYSPE